MCVLDVQERTALADTPGSRFTTKCEGLIAEVSFGELLSDFTEHIDLLFRKVADKGEDYLRLIHCHALGAALEADDEVSMLALQRAWIAAWMC